MSTKAKISSSRIIYFMSLITVMFLADTVAANKPILTDEKTVDSLRKKAVTNDDVIGKFSSIYLNKYNSFINDLNTTKERYYRQQSLVNVLKRLKNNYSEARSEGFLLLSFLQQDNRSQHQYSPKQRGLKSYASCFQDIRLLLTSLPQQWALRMMDAAGKPGGGVLQQNVRFLGDYDECLNIKTGQRFGTKYCLATIDIDAPMITNSSRPLSVQTGLCVPDTCDETSLKQILNQYLAEIFDNGTVSASQSQCQEDDMPLTDKAKVVIVVLTVIGTLVVLGTLYDVFIVQGIFTRICYDGDDPLKLASGILRMGGMHDSIHRSQYEPLLNSTHNSSAVRGVLGRILLAFSIYTNTSKLLSTSSESGTIDCIIGIRFVSMTWVVLGHSILYGISMMENVKPYLDMSYGRWTFQVILNALVAVDTFFALSGLLLTYTVLMQFNRSGPSVGFFANMYFHRFWRLTPAYMLVIMTYAPLFKYISDGPLWPKDGIEKNECEDSWWTNLLYVNNFVNVDTPCMGWSWYLANDMQFFVISPIIFLPLYYFGATGLIVAFIMLLGTCLATAVITFENDLPPNLPLTQSSNLDYVKLYYIKPYTRMGPYIIGMLTGYLLYLTDCKARIRKVVVGLGWILATAIALTVQYGLYEHFNGHPLTKDISALYNSLHTTAWSVAMCWVIFACANGYGGFINTLLSWKALVPLSRLTYCVYLIHPVIVSFHYLSQRRLTYLDNNNVAFSFLGILVMSYGVGYLTSMMFEAPMIGIEKAVKKIRS